MTALAHKATGRLGGFACFERVDFTLVLRWRAIGVLPIPFKFGSHRHDANTLENFAATQPRKNTVGRSDARRQSNELERCNCG